MAVGLEPVTEVSGEGIEIEFETVTAKGRDVRLGEGLAQLMDQVVSQFLSAWAEGERWDELGRGLQGHPQPQVVIGLTGCGEQLVELDVSESQAVAEVLMQGLSVKSGAGGVHQMVAKPAVAVVM